MRLAARRWSRADGKVRGRAAGVRRRRGKVCREGAAREAIVFTSRERWDRGLDEGGRAVAERLESGHLTAGGEPATTAVAFRAALSGSEGLHRSGGGAIALLGDERFGPAIGSHRIRRVNFPFGAIRAEVNDDFGSGEWGIKRKRCRPEETGAKRMCSWTGTTVPRRSGWRWLFYGPKGTSHPGGSTLAVRR